MHSVTTRHGAVYRIFVMDLSGLVPPLLALIAGAASLAVAQKLGVGPVQREYVDLLKGLNVTQKERIDQLEAENTELRGRVEQMEKEHTADRKRWARERRNLELDLQAIRNDLIELREQQA